MDNCPDQYSNSTMDHPSMVLAQAREHLEALRNSGLSREALLALFDEQATSQMSLAASQQHQQQPIQQPSPPHYQPMQHQSSQQQHPSPPQLQHQLSSDGQQRDMEIPPQPQQPPPPPPMLHTPPQMKYEHDSSSQASPQSTHEPLSATLPPSGMPSSFNGIQGHQYKKSISSSIASNSSHESVFSSASAARSTLSVSSTGSIPDSKFWCTSCDKTFKRKFDWKRHEEEFHERWRKYPCPNCNQSFWGPNTFNQHHKSAHGCKSCPHAESVVKHMRKRKAWGCGFCAALHGKFEKHIDHVASHFEAGSTKQDWLHSNVIYGLLHQHGAHEAWKEHIAKKQDRFNGHQPMFSWSPESTGRAQGFVENESPGQLQDFLEFYDGTREAADKIVKAAWSTVHVVLRQKQMPISQPVSPYAGPIAADNSHKFVPISSLQTQHPMPRRSASMASMSSGRRTIRRSPSSTRRPTVLPEHMAAPMSLSTPAHPGSMSYDQFLQPPQQHQHHMDPQSSPLEAHHHGQSFHSVNRLSLDKALPPAPVPMGPLPVISPMELDFPMFDSSGTNMMLPSHMLEHWPSMTTLVEDHPMSDQGYNMNWQDMNQYPHGA
ncbi:hypothetical protein Micbo1qcDRAFT_70757 [Microdochium bolleyi]|uniref:C2H2-type domain-containing protein n=1 Tax=Microdochium bolleyi TaxID=196109 RepID=A0A136IZV0_9PEZI|nr:hypothetical protein Micbo1qcDRAFT_70757 [Microdochium bolleyi]